MNVYTVLDVVSIHAPAWGATKYLVDTDAQVFVSIHAPAWGATTFIAPRVNIRAVSIHAPAWGATRCRHRHLCRRTFQFTLPHGERRRRAYVQGWARMVSIHAPAWGATEKGLCRFHETFVSIHAPAWGATRVSHSSFLPTLFQFTLPHGERPRVREQFGNNAAVSIHAPAWGATLKPRREAPTTPSFNSRSRMGSDWVLLWGAPV